MKFKVEDKVKLNKNIKFFRFGRGDVGYDEIGEITDIDNIFVYVNFPSCDYWGGLESELKLVKESKTFFKKLPNDYTGTIEVENGYIVKKEILDEEEKEYLSAVIRPFRKDVKNIYKRIDDIKKDYEYIRIVMNRCEDSFSLPSFKKGTMYKGMELNKEYTLKELRLDV